MGIARDHITASTRTWIEAQPMFFVATSPLSSDGHINLSPKGLDTFRVTGPAGAMYLDLTGSGAETIAHIRENGRITVMFTSFGETARIVRLYGSGVVHDASSEAFAELIEAFPDYPAARSVITIDVTRVADSCGFGVPVMDLRDQRARLTAWGDAKTDDEVVTYWREKNGESIDGLPALVPPLQ